METFKNRNGLSLEYKIIGEGVPFVFLHGLGATVYQFEKFYERLDGVQYILLNQEGQGNSQVDYDKLTFDVMGDDVIDLLDHLHIEKAYFSGISMGAAVSLNVATRYPQRVIKALLIRNAWIEEPIKEDIRKAYSDLAEGLKRNDIEYFKNSEGFKLVLSQNSPYTKNNFLEPFAIDYNVKYYQKYTVLPPQAPIKSLADLNNLTMPVTIVACKGDWCHAYEFGTRLHELVKNSKFIEVPNKDTDTVTHNKILNEEIRRMVEL